MLSARSGKDFLPQTPKERLKAQKLIMDSIKSEIEILDSPKYFSFVGMDYHIKPTLINELNYFGFNTDTLAFYGLVDGGGVAFVDRNRFDELATDTIKESWAKMTE